MLKKRNVEKLKHKFVSLQTDKENYKRVFVMSVQDKNITIKVDDGYKANYSSIPLDDIVKIVRWQF